MNRIDAKFEELKRADKKALITFITCGDGGYDTTENAVFAMERAGADIIELGVPFSDPVAEGPVIQAASERALASGTTLAGIFEMAERIRKKTEIPLLFMMYINTIYRYGTEKFFSQCKEYGIDGVIVPDMPYEERFEMKDIAEKYGKYSISLVAPTSTDRIKMISQEAKGFLYCVSSTGVTGMRNNFETDFEKFIGTVKKYTDIPCAIGFGISGPEQAAMLSKYCDGVIVGSAIVKLIEKYGKDSEQHIYNLVKSLRDAI